MVWPLTDARLQVRSTGFGKDLSDLLKDSAEFALRTRLNALEVGSEKDQLPDKLRSRLTRTDIGRPD